MANQYKNKVVYNGNTLIDLTSDTVAAQYLQAGITAHNAAGQQITGTATNQGTEWTSGIYQDNDGYIRISPLAGAGGITFEDGYIILSADAGDSGESSGSATLITKSINQNGTYDAEDDDADGYSSVTVSVPTGTARSSSDLTVSGATVTVPAGLYSEQATKSVASGSASTPSTAITANPTIQVGSDGLITASVSGSQNVTPSVSPGYVSSGTAGTVSVSGSNTSQLPTQGGTTYNTASTDQTINSGKYLTGNQTIKAVTTSGIDAANIKVGVTVKVGDSNDDDRIKGVTGTYTSDANATAADIASGKTAYVNGSKITGTASASKNIQIDNSTQTRRANSYGDTGLTLTVAKTGTYTVTWTAWRGSSSGTMGTNLHVGNTEGTNQQTWTGTYGQMITLTGQSYTQGAVLRLYATSGSNSRSVYVANLMIKEE